jgi:hypothetical protein
VVRILYSKSDVRSHKTSTFFAFKGPNVGLARLQLGSPVWLAKIDVGGFSIFGH